MSRITAPRLLLASAVAACVTGTAPAMAQLEEVIVTAQKREQSLLDVPLSVATLSGERFTSLFEGGADVRGLSASVPGLYVESSNGRVAPRFYIRGLGNIDFDLAASQPVSVIMDDVVKENVVLKSFPLFDVERVEVLRGPQGSLFGRNTTAGIVKFDSYKPTQETEGRAKLDVGDLGTLNFDGAIGGGLTDTVSGRVAVLYQNRDDFIDNDFTGNSDALGGFEEQAIKGALLWEPTEDLSMLLGSHYRDLDGTAAVFRANIFNKGSNNLNNNYDRETVFFDEGNNNPQEYDNAGVNFKVDYNLGGMTLTSITSYEDANGSSLGDIDGGFGAAKGNIATLNSGCAEAAAHFRPYHGRVINCIRQREITADLVVVGILLVARCSKVLVVIGIADTSGQGPVIGEGVVTLSEDSPGGVLVLNRSRGNKERLGFHFQIGVEVEHTGLPVEALAIVAGQTELLGSLIDVCRILRLRGEWYEPRTALG